MFSRILVVASTVLAEAAFAGGWDLVGDIAHPDRIVRNVARETNNAANQMGPVGPFIAAPITGPLNAFSNCAQDLRTCPQEVINQTPQANVIQACVANISRCPDNVIKMAPMQTVWPIMMQYKQGLISQTRGQWFGLPETFIEDFASYYPEINLRQVRYATNINTVHGQAITFANLIFFPSRINLDTEAGIKLMLHELQHTVQYRLKGGEQQFLSEYGMHALGHIIQCRCVNVHDEIGTERDAIAKAADVFRVTGQPIVVTNKCDDTVNFAVHYLTSSGSWRTRYWYSIPPAERTYLSADDRRLMTPNALIYFYAIQPDSNQEWSGNDGAWEVDGETQGFIKVRLSSTDQVLGVSLSCNQ